MAINFRQTDTGGDCDARGSSAGFDALCTTLGGSSVGATDDRQCTDGGTAGTGTVSITLASSASNVGGFLFQLAVTAGVTWAAGPWTVRLNVTTANMNLTWGDVWLCRVNSSCVNQESLGHTGALAIALGTTGVKTATITGSAATPSAGDKIVVGFGFSNGAMSNQTFAYTVNQLIDSPFTTSTANITPPQGNLALSTTAPTVARTDNRDISPAQGNLLLSSVSPTVTQGVSRDVPQGNLLLSGTAPSVSVSNNLNISPAAGDLVLSPTAPTVARTDHRDISPAAGNLVLSGTAPTVESGGSLNISPAAGNLALSTTAPTVQAGDSRNISPTAGQLLLSTLAPTVAATANINISPATVDLVLSSLAPAVAVSGAAPAAEPPVSHGWIEYPGRKRKRRKPEPEEPKPPSVRETIERILGRITDEPQPERVPQLADAVDTAAPERPIIPLSEAQRAQVIAALSAVPEEQLLAAGLEQAVETAVQLIKDLERDDEEALIMILALTVQ